MGVDPRFNSLHLDPARRQDYRRAREVLLDSRGVQTVYVERRQGEGTSGTDPSATMCQASGPAPATAQFWLLDREFIYPLKIGVNTMGRSSDNDVVVEDLYVSRRHCAVLVHHDGTCELHDTASKNGTFLNGGRLKGPTPLRPGDEIRICNRQFVFQTRNAPASPPPDPSPATHTLAD